MPKGGELGYDPSGTMSGLRYCPKCGAQNDSTMARCLRCGLVFGEYRPAPVTVIRAPQERRYNIAAWMLGAMVLMVLGFAAYFLSVQGLFLADGGRGKSPLQEMVERSASAFQRLQAAKNDGERGSVHGEIGEILATLTLIPEGQDMESNLLLQRTLYELDAYTGPSAVMGADAVRAFEQRFVLIGRMVRTSSPSTP